MLLQGGDELRCTGQRLLLVHQNAVHVSQPRFDGLGSVMGVILPPGHAEAASHGH